MNGRRLRRPPSSSVAGWPNIGSPRPRQRSRIDTGKRTNRKSRPIKISNGRLRPHRGIGRLPHRLSNGRTHDEGRQDPRGRWPFKAVIDTPVPLLAAPPLQDVRTLLLAEFPYAEKVVDFALMDLVGCTTVRLRPLLLLGDPGGGKTRSRAPARPASWRPCLAYRCLRGRWRRLRGTDKRWQTAEPSSVACNSPGGHANPLILVDELEKAGTRADYGRLWDCLLAFLEPETACRYPDPALQILLDLSHVSYVATANSLTKIPSPLLDRPRIVDFPKPAAHDLEAMLPAILVDLASERSLDPRWTAPFDVSEQTAIRKYWKGGSVRRLRRIVDVMMQEREKAATKN